MHTDSARLEAALSRRARTGPVHTTAEQRNHNVDEQLVALVGDARLRQSLNVIDVSSGDAADYVNEQPVDARVARKFRMKRRRNQ